MITHNHWDFCLGAAFIIETVVFFHALERQHSQACSQYIYLRIINHYYHKRLPEPGHNSVPRAGAGVEDPYFLLDIKIEKAGKSRQIWAADRAGLEGHWGWVEPRHLLHLLCLLALSPLPARHVVEVCVH